MITLLHVKMNYIFETDYFKDKIKIGNFRKLLLQKTSLVKLRKLKKDESATDDISYQNYTLSSNMRGSTGERTFSLFLENGR